MGVKCVILLQNTNRGVYRSGEPVKGTLTYSLDKPMTFTSIDICLVGKGKCQWSVRIGNKSSTTYRNKEKYVNACKDVLAGRANQIIPAGTYDCPFEFFLPVNIPTSFKNKICTIQYKVVAKFLKDNFFGTKNKFKTEITVYGYVKPLSLEPALCRLRKDLFTLSSNNKVEVRAEIERTCLTPGENFKLNLAVNNDSNVSITIKAELMKYLTYVSDNDNKHINKESVKTTTANSATLEGKSVTYLTLIVRTLPSLYSIQHSKVMIGEYKLKLTAKLPFPHINASVETPVVIGERRGNQSTATATVMGCDDEEDAMSPSSSKISANDEIDKEETVEDFFEKYDRKWKDLQGQMSRQHKDED